MIKSFLNYITDDNTELSNSTLHNLIQKKVTESILDKKIELSMDILNENPVTDKVKVLGTAGLYPKEDELAILRIINIISDGGDLSTVQRQKAYELLLKLIEIDTSSDLFIKIKQHLENDQIKIGEAVMTNESIETPSIIDIIENDSAKKKANIDSIFKKLRGKDSELTMLDYNRLHDLFYDGDGSGKNWSDTKKKLKSLLIDYSNDEEIPDLIQTLSSIINKGSKLIETPEEDSEDKITLVKKLGNKLEIIKELKGKLEPLDYEDLYNIFFRNKADMEAGREVLIRLIAQYKENEEATVVLNKLGPMLGIKSKESPEIEPDEAEDEE